MKNEDKEKEKIEEEEFSEKNPEDTSREATIMEVFYGICHMKEYIHEVIKVNDKKWMAIKRIYGKRMDAIIKLTKAQDSIIRTLENIAKRFSGGDLI